MSFLTGFAEAMAETGRAFRALLVEPWVVFMLGGFVMLFAISAMTTL